jgi:DNA-binding winged helix-turn-helix (wHTH) protein
MKNLDHQHSGVIRLERMPDFALGKLEISPSRRTISGDCGRAVLEPRMMQVLVTLAEQSGHLVTREALVEKCWSGGPVGDDSLNRAIAGIRRGLRVAVGSAVRIQTVSSAGYSLMEATQEAAAQGAATAILAEAVEAGWRSWRLGMPSPDIPTLDRLREAASIAPERADVWALLALVARNAAEHADAADCASFVADCEAAGRRALVLDPRQGCARAALISLPPIFGDWIRRRPDLIQAQADEPGNIVLTHDLAMLEMATGRPSAAAPLIEMLMERDPLAAIFHYKRVYHLWTLGRVSEMDRVADRAMQLWPHHPAIWFARFWSLAFTERPAQASQQLADAATLPIIPPPARSTMEVTLRAVMDRANEEARKSAIEANVAASQRGPAQSVAAIIHLGGLGAVEEAFDVAEGYLARRGPIAVSVRRTDTDPSITDQHRRVTQMLFIPATASMRACSRFDTLCRTIGLEDYWSRMQLRPDHALDG